MWLVACLVEFAPFRLDLRDERLWYGDEALALTPKAFAVLRQVAPSWLVHLPAVGLAGDREALTRTASGVAPARRMMRELAEALEVMTTTLDRV